MTCIKYFFSSIILLVMFLLYLSTPSTASTTTYDNPNGLSLKLLHRFSLPSYKNKSFLKFVEKNKQIYMNAKFNAHHHLFQPTIEQLYFVNLSIGDPPVPQYMFMDIGSSLVWVAAHMYKRFIYNPPYSRTFKHLNCSTPECRLSSEFICGEHNNCVYVKKYLDTRQSSGYLGLDRFVFESKDHKVAALDNVLFGISVRNIGDFFTGSNFNGILGLGPQPTSLLRNFPGKFSYCIDNIQDKNSQLSYLYLGDADDDYYWLTTSMHLHPNSQWYMVDMECISLQNSCLAVSPSIFRYDGNDPYTGVAFDTGTLLTYLADEAYDILADQVAELMRSRGFEEPMNIDRQLCYNGDLDNVTQFPSVLFQFDKYVHLDIHLEKGSLFYYQTPERFCLSMVKSSTENSFMKDFTIIGLMAQQNHTMGFDLEKSLVSIDYNACVS